MAVAPDLRRQGYGALLLKAAESFAALAKKNEIYLHVR
jgi:GNAT superfamily N-acetyltransferase